MIRHSPPTGAEISARAGVSKSTVSRALRNDPRISAKMREKISTIAEEMNYAPNAIAKHLATQRSRIIGFIGSEAENTWYQENVQSLISHIGAAGMQTMMFQVAPDGDVADVVAAVLEYRVAGCIVIPTVPISATAITAFQKFQTPIVLLNRTLPGFKTSSVQCDQAGGARALAKLLLAAEHQRIALIAGPDTPTAVQREQGFTEALASVGKRLFARAEGDFTFADAYRATLELVRKKPLPDAIFAVNDLMAFAVIDALRSRGLNVPDDVSVVGFDNSHVGSWPGYSLTTIAQPIDHMFARAVQLIVEQNVDVSRPPETVLLGGRLILRDSARIPAELDGFEIEIEHAQRI
jgi:DNA-binding LacI/PurR family transcriptional regulator